MGKSTLLTLLTGTSSEAAAYEFTTLTCIPGVIHYNDAKIQLLDLPGIIEGAAQGKGMWPEVDTSVAAFTLLVPTAPLTCKTRAAGSPCRCRDRGLLEFE